MIIVVSYRAHGNGVDLYESLNDQKIYSKKVLKLFQVFKV